MFTLVDRVEELIESHRKTAAKQQYNLLLLPEAAVVYDAQRRAFVDVVDPAERTGRRRVPIKVGVGNGTRIQVLDGLKQGDKVVLPG